MLSGFAERKLSHPAAIAAANRSALSPPTVAAPVVLTDSSPIRRCAAADFLRTDRTHHADRRDPHITSFTPASPVASMCRSTIRARRAYSYCGVAAAFIRGGCRRCWPAGVKPCRRRSMSCLVLSRRHRALGSITPPHKPAAHDRSALRSAPAASHTRAFGHAAEKTY